MRRMQNASVATSGFRKIFRGSLHLFTGHMVRILVQSVYFVIVTRGLGAADFGRYTGMQALLLGLVAFGSLGYPILSLRAVARDPSSRRAIWSDAVRVTLAIGGLLVAATTLFGPRLLAIPFPRWPLLALAVSDLLLYGLLMVISGIQQGAERLDRMAVIEGGLAAARLATVGGIGLLWGLTLPRFAAAHLAGSAACLLLVLLLYGRGWAWPLAAADWAGIRERARDGFYISLSAAGRNFLLGIDKMLLPALAGLAIAGQYAAGFRVLAFALLPVQAFMAALYPRFFQRGAESVDSLMCLWRRTAPLALFYALPVSAALFVAAPLLSPALGSEYPEAPRILRHLIGVLVIQALSMPLGDALAGADRFGYRSACIFAAALVNLGLTLALIPAWGWYGAVAAVYLSQLLLLGLYGWGLRKILLRGSRAPRGREGA